MPSAELDLRPEYAPRVRQTLTGLEAVVHYRCDTADPIAALTATGLPALGSVWNWGGVDVNPLLVLRERDVQFMSGSAAGGAVNGRSIVRCLYGTATLRASQPPPEADLEYTIRQREVAQVVVREAANASAGFPYDLPIAGGDGAPRLTVLTNLVAVRYLAVADWDNSWPAAMDALHATTNSAALVFAPIFGTDDEITMAIGTCLYVGSDISTEQGLVKMEHHFRTAVDHKFRWRVQDADGQYTGTVIESELYASAAFPTGILRA